MFPSVWNVYFVILVVILSCYGHDWPDDESDHHRSLILKVYPVPDLGSSHVLPNRTVFGCQLKTWDSKELFPPAFRRHINSTNIYQLRTRLFDSLKPISMLQWAVMDFRPCPHFRHNVGHRAERGHCASHLQIWMEFAFFDHDVEEAYHRYKPEYLTSTSYSSVSGTFQVKEDGEHVKNGIPSSSNDLMFIFEDGVVPSPQFNMTHLLDDIQNAEPFDILPLMNCSQARLSMMNVAAAEHGKIKHSSLGAIDEVHAGSQVCLAAYVITRKAASTLQRLMDVCGRGIEMQLVALVQEEVISMRHLPSDRTYFVDQAPE